MKIILHCSDSFWGNAAIISKWHVQRGWSNIGYHYVILNGHLSSKVHNESFNGHIETGRPLDDDSLLENFEYGSHVLGMNSKSVGICLIGLSSEFSEKQIKSMIELLRMLKKQFGEIEISQHSDWDPKKPYCAGLDKFYLKELNRNI